LSALDLDKIGVGLPTLADFYSPGSDRFTIQIASPYNYTGEQRTDAIVLYLYDSGQWVRAVYNNTLVSITYENNPVIWARGFEDIYWNSSSVERVAEDNGDITNLFYSTAGLVRIPVSLQRPAMGEVSFPEHIYYQLNNGEPVRVGRDYIVDGDGERSYINQYTIEFNAASFSRAAGFDDRAEIPLKIFPANGDRAEFPYTRDHFSKDITLCVSHYPPLEIHILPTQ
jgi:hypothetical protein